ncbi:VWA domain-containing protein [Thiomicrorhabdus sp. 6S3-12]|uniref:VWA domain-containing protein n=1 Tax=Thiomicrorhabdus sp. 6S3-12 TaxID=2819681 RepID=UPI001AAD5918|nr:VWA domain-containing protein [Thiomicrorhabdus sp. 6S3-12]MBO1924828.1 VWA domain-containing protein [Thiomicrorhabdus sp. 6S3-12]
MNWSSLLANFEFIWPWMFAILPLPWIIRILLRPVAQNQSTLFAPEIVARIGHSLPSENLIEPQHPKFRVPFAYALLWFLLVTATARPVWFLTPTPFQQSGKEMMLAVDLSGSMQKADMYLGGDNVNRLIAVKSVVANFIAQRQGDRMGLVVFGSQAFLQSPLTYDLNTVKTLLDESQIGMAGNNTAIGDAIGLTLKHLRKTKQTDAVLILLTDGSNTSGIDPIKAAEQAQKMQLKIYTVGVGKERSGFNGLIPSKTDMDVTTLSKIADMTGGQFFRANDTEQLQQIYQYINQLESVQHEVFSYRLRSELYFWPLGAAMLLSLLLAWLHLRRLGG